MRSFPTVFLSIPVEALQSLLALEMFRIYIYIYIVCFDRFCQIPFEHGTALWDDPWQHSFCKCKTDIRIHSQHLGLKFTTSSYIFHFLDETQACPEDLAYDPWWVQEAGHNDIEMTHRRVLLWKSSFGQDFSPADDVKDGVLRETTSVSESFGSAREERIESKETISVFWLSCWMYHLPCWGEIC